VLTTSRPRAKNIVNDEDRAERQVEIQASDKADKKVRSLLLIALDDKHAMSVINCPTATEGWERLIAIHEQRSSANKIVLQREFFDLHMRHNETAQEYTGWYNGYDLFFFAFIAETTQASDSKFTSLVELMFGNRTEEKI